MSSPGNLHSYTVTCLDPKEGLGFSRKTFFSAEKILWQIIKVLGTDMQNLLKKNLGPKSQWRHRALKQQIAGELISELGEL